MATQLDDSGHGEDGYPMTAIGNPNTPPDAVKFEDELQGAPASEEDGEGQEQEDETFFTQEWLEPVAHFFGFPTAWTARPSQEYEDSYAYRLNPSRKRTPIHRKCDAELTEDGKRLVMLKVQATASLRRIGNSTWRRQYIRDSSTTLFQLSKIPDRSRKTAALKWGIPASWLVFVLNWILALAGLCVWTVNNNPPA